MEVWKGRGIMGIMGRAIMGIMGSMHAVGALALPLQTSGRWPASSEASPPWCPIGEEAPAPMHGNSYACCLGSISTGAHLQCSILPQIKWHQSTANWSLDLVCHVTEVHQGQVSSYISVTCTDCRTVCSQSASPSPRPDRAGHLAHTLICARLLPQPQRHAGCEPG